MKQIQRYFDNLKRQCCKQGNLALEPNTTDWWTILTRLNLTYEHPNPDQVISTSVVEQFYSHLQPLMPKRQLAPLLSCLDEYTKVRNMLRHYAFRLKVSGGLEINKPRPKGPEIKASKTEENIYHFKIDEFQCRCYLPDEKHVPILEITIPSDKDVPDTVVFYERNQFPYGKIVVIKYYK